MDNSVVILKQINKAKVIVCSQSSKVYENVFSIPTIIDLHNYPFESKLIEYYCDSCSEKIEIGIYENGGHLRGPGASENIITGWDYSSQYKLNHADSLYLSKALNLLIEKLNSDEYALIINNNYKHCFVLLKKCLTCNSEYILTFEPTGEYYREIALQFYIHSIFKVKTSEEFKRKYVQLET
jgi:hypothetical protein